MSKLLGETTKTIGDVMVALCQSATDGQYFDCQIQPTLLQHAHTYSAEQRGQIENLGFSLAKQTSASADNDVLNFCGVHGKRRLLNRLKMLAGPDRTFMMHNKMDISKQLLSKRKSGVGVLFGCDECGVRYASTTGRLAQPELTSSSFKCLCCNDFCYKDAVGRKSDVSYRNISLYVQSRHSIYTTLYTPRDEFVANRSNVVLRCSLCCNEWRMQPREVFDKKPKCDCAQRVLID